VLIPQVGRTSLCLERLPRCDSDHNKMIGRALFVAFLALLAAVEFGERGTVVLLSVGELPRNVADLRPLSQLCVANEQMKQPRISYVGCLQL
jgi:hypothetical protein